MKKYLDLTVMLSLCCGAVLSCQVMAAEVDGYISKCTAGDADACVDAGYSYDNGASGAPEDASKAAEYFAKGCSLGNGLGCYLAGGYYEGKKDYASAFKVYEKGCDLDYGEACNSLGKFYEKGIEVSVDLYKARDLYKKGNEYSEYESEVDDYERLNNLIKQQESEAQQAAQSNPQEEQSTDNAQSAQSAQDNAQAEPASQAQQPAAQQPVQGQGAIHNLLGTGAATR